MSIQTKLENSSISSKRKLYDNSIRIHGQEVYGLRIKVTIDKYGDDDSTPVIVEQNEITVYMDYLNLEIPLNRYRIDTETSTINSESIYLFEVLPIIAYVKWEDEIESGDLLVLVIKDNDLDIPIVFRVSDMIGRLQKNLLYKKYNIAPYNPSSLDSTIKSTILNYINSQ